MTRSSEVSPPLQTISTFARAVGLSPSALRLYADNGLVTPAEVDEQTGYRYYTPTQQRRAIWVRRLREVGLDLRTIGRVLDGPAEESGKIIDAWLGDTRQHAARIEDLAQDLRAGLRAQRDIPLGSRTEAVLDGAQLAAALTQVEGARTSPNDPSGLDGVLLDISTESVSVVATDRRLLLARTALPAEIDGPPARVQVDARVSDTVAWLDRRATVTVVVDQSGRSAGSDSGTRAELRADDSILRLSVATDRFPSCSQVLAFGTPIATRIILPLNDLRRAVPMCEDTVAQLSATEGSARLALGDAQVDGHQVGEDATIEVGTHGLRRLVSATVGDRLVCDIRSEHHPLLWSSPSQPDFAGASMARP